MKEYRDTQPFKVNAKCLLGSRGSPDALDRPTLAKVVYDVLVCQVIRQVPDCMRGEEFPSVFVLHCSDGVRSAAHSPNTAGAGSPAPCRAAIGPGAVETPKPRFKQLGPIQYP